MTTDPFEAAPASEPADTRPAPAPGSTHRIGRLARGIVRGHVGRVPVGGVLAAIAVAALLSAAYAIGTPATGNGGAGPLYSRTQSAGEAASPGAAPVDVKDGSNFGTGSLAAGPALPPVAENLPVETTQIVKTGSMSLEISDLRKAVADALSKIEGVGGYVSQSSTAGEKDTAVATVVYRLPAARWDEALAAMRALAGRVVSEQTNSTDVTLQVVDLDARLANLRTTEAALQAIMARATVIADVLAVEKQLSDTQGQIEELSAQQKQLKDQAAMSTLTVTFSLPGQTVTTQATQEWSLGAQVDEAGAALIHIGQGLATIGVWVLIVGLPVVIGIAVLMGIAWILRRLFGRRRRATASA